MLFDLKVISIILASQKMTAPPSKKNSKNPTGYSTRPPGALCLAQARWLMDLCLQPDSAPTVTQPAALFSRKPPACLCAQPRLHPNECREGKWRVSVKLL